MTARLARREAKPPLPAFAEMFTRSPLEQRQIILDLLALGQTEDRLAAHWGVKITLIRRRVILLRGIGNEAFVLLKDKEVNPHVFEILRKLKPGRQVEVAQLMIASGNLTSGYVKALLAASRQTDLVNPHRTKSVANLSADQMKRMEKIMETLQPAFMVATKHYKSTILDLIVCERFISRVIANTRILDYLSGQAPALVADMRTVLGRIATCARPVLRGGRSRRSERTRLRRPRKIRNIDL